MLEKKDLQSIKHHEEYMRRKEEDMMTRMQDGGK